MHEIWKEISFDAAHALVSPDGDKSYSRVHGHSYQAEVWLRGNPGVYGWVMDMAEFGQRLEVVRTQLDHRFLNEVDGMGPPTMENISAFIWRALSDISCLHKVVVRCDSAKEGCVFYGSDRSSSKIDNRSENVLAHA